MVSSERPIRATGRGRPRCPGAMPRFLGVALVTALCLGAGAPQARAEESYSQQWKVASAGLWPPATAEDRVVLKSGNRVTAYSLADGKKLWSTRLAKLRYGSGSMTAGTKYVYLISAVGLQLLSLKDGSKVRLRRIQRPISVYYRNETVYVSYAGGVIRLDAEARKVVGRAEGITGELRKAQGQHVVLLTQQSTAEGMVKRLQVLDLDKGSVIYRFKLLVPGGHRVVEVERGHLAFIDYSRRGADGKSSKKLYYTEVDFKKREKLKDINLSSRYIAAESDTLWAVSGPAGEIFLAQHGTPKDPSLLLAYDPASSRVLWQRKGLVASMGLTLHGGKLWGGLVDAGGAAKAVVIQPDTGAQVAALPLDAPGSSAPVGVGGRVLVRTRTSVYCFAPGAPAVADGGDEGDEGEDEGDEDEGDEDEGGAPPPPESGLKVGRLAADGWRTVRQAQIGFSLDLPRGWRLDSAKVLKMGGVRMVLPFVRARKSRRGPVYIGSVQVLTWEDAGRDADGLWRSVYAQRKKLNPDVKVSAVHRVKNVGGSGVDGIRAVYSFAGPSKQRVQLRSLCVVNNGVAYELRAWARPGARRGVWRRVEEIFSRFKPTK